MIGLYTGASKVRTAYIEQR